MRSTASTLLSLVAAVGLAGACQPAPSDGESDTTGRDDDDDDDDDNDDACDVGFQRSGSDCVAVPLLSVFLSDTVDEVQPQPSQRAFVTSLQPVRSAPINRATVRASDGGCVIYEPFEGSAVLPVHEPDCGDWGTLDVGGTPVPFVCAAGVAQRSVEIGYAPGASIAVSSTGGDVFPSFSGSITAPQRLTLSLDGTVAAGASFTVHFGDRAAADDVTMAVTAIGDDGEVVNIFCSVEPGAIEQSITPTLSNLLPQAVFNWTISASARHVAEIAWDDPTAEVALTVAASSSAVLRAPRD